MRDIRQSGSEGAEAETNRPSLPLSNNIYYSLFYRPYHAAGSP